MSDGKYQPLTDNMDDLPRTLRRERENRDRAALEQIAREQSALQAGPPPSPRARGQLQPTSVPPYAMSEAANPYDQPYAPQDQGPPTVIVKRFKVPFFSLMAFFIKAVFAAIPAMLILIALFYGFGIGLQTYFPELIKMKILISFP